LCDIQRHADAPYCIELLQQSRQEVPMLSQLCRTSGNSCSRNYSPREAYERLAKQPIHSRSCRVCSRVCEWPLVVSPEQALVGGELIKIGQVCATKVPAEVSRCINCHCLSKTRERRCQSNIARSIRHQRRRTSETLTWSWRRPGSSYSISKSPTPHSPTVTTTNCHTTHPQ
jgi:hypothetical protein